MTSSVDEIASAGCQDNPSQDEIITCCCTSSMKEQMFANISQNLNDAGSYAFEAISSCGTACFRGWKVEITIFLQFSLNSLVCSIPDASPAVQVHAAKLPGLGSRTRHAAHAALAVQLLELG